MVKKLHSSLPSSLLCTLCLLFFGGSHSMPLNAQQQKGWEFTLGAPRVEPPAEVSESSFVATWSNVSAQQMNKDGTPYNEVFVRLITTREIEAKSDGIYKIANASIKPNPSGIRKSISSTQTLLNEQMSQTDWSSSLVYWTDNGFSINSKDIENSGMPDDMIPAMARLTSPVMDLSNEDRKYTVEFTLKALQAYGQSVRMEIFGYGEEISYPGQVPGLKQFTLPADGKEHKFSMELEGGTWCHRIIIELLEYAEVEFSKEVVVTQNLKKGNRSFRSTFYKTLPLGEVTADQENPAALFGPALYRVKYSHEFNDLDGRCLDLAAANSDGERIAYRMLYADKSPGYSSTWILDKSTYSDPSYFDNIEDPNSYLYVGYCNYEAPNYNAIEPSGVSWDGYHGGAIKLTKEMLKDHVGSKVVGIRFASAAARQKDQINNDPGYFDVKLPCIFLANSVLTVDKSDINDPKVITSWDPIQVTSVGRLKDGWNTLFFDNPYEITAESEFFAGAYAYDAAAKGGILVRSFQSPGVDPNSAWIGTNWSTYKIGEAEFRSYVSKGDGPLLMEVIIKPKSEDPTVQNCGELRGLSAPSFIFSDMELKPSINLFNSGVKAISEIKLETILGGKKQEQTIKLAKYLAPSVSQDVELQAISHDGMSGKVQLTVTLLEVNGVALVTPSSQTAELEIINRDEVFERTTLVELFTSEACQYCPRSVQWMEEIIKKPENTKIKKRLAFVSHHSFNRKDFMMLPYSLELAPFFGVKNNAGNIVLVSPSSPTNMFNRMPIPALGDAKGKNGSVYSIIKNQTELERVAKAAEDNPASIYVEVKPWFKKDENKLNVQVLGHASARLDRSRPVYLTLMITQDHITPRNQQGSNVPEGFVHTNVLRYVDEAGFMGTEVKFDDESHFKIVKDIDIKTTDAKNGDLPTNTFLLEGNNKTAEDVMKQVNVIAILHYYEELPTANNVVDNDKRLLGNEVLNVAQRRVSFTPFNEAIDGVAKQEVRVRVQDGTVRVNIPISNLQLYDMAGRMHPAIGLQAGVYIVRLELLDGSVLFTKIVAE